MNNDQIEKILAAVDKKSIDEFLSFLSDNCSFRFGNLPAVHGPSEITAFLGGFYGSIESLTHEVDESWEIPGGSICRGTVSYLRHDKTTLSVPFSNIFKINNGKIYEYLIFADTSQL